MYFLFIGDASLQAATGSSALFVPKLRLLHSFSFHSFNITTFMDHFNTKLDRLDCPPFYHVSPKTSTFHARGAFISAKEIV